MMSIWHGSPAAAHGHPRASSCGARKLDVRDPVQREVTATYLLALGFGEAQVREEIAYLSSR